jgi:DeoR family transcriptional regulator, aga operon transcriptional repressor
MTRSTLRRADRVTTILGRLAEDGSVDAARLATEFAVSPATIRRDLQMLEDQKLLARTHGGAVAADVEYELPVRYRGSHHRDQKLAIARCAAARLPHGPLTVGFTGGTTTHEVARLVASRYDLTVVTNALDIAVELALRPRLKLVMTGGVSRTQSYELVGPLAENTLTGLNIGVAVVGVDGISARGGLTTHDEVEAHTDHVMISRASRVIVVADGSKVGQDCLARICDLSAVSELVTDASANAEALTAIRAAGVTVAVAGPA